MLKWFGNPRRCGGMADTADLKSAGGNSVPVRVRSAAPAKGYPIRGIPLLHSELPDSNDPNADVRGTSACRRSRRRQHPDSLESGQRHQQRDTPSGVSLCCIQICRSRRRHHTPICSANRGVFHLTVFFCVILWNYSTGRLKNYGKRESVSEEGPPDGSAGQ